MKIEKLNENNIKKFIKDTEHNYNLSVNKSYFGIKKDGKFIGGYDFFVIGLVYFLEMILMRIYLKRLLLF